MNAVTFLIKPSSSKCNMRCSYCFYSDITNNRTIKDYGFMSETTMLSIIEKAFDSVKHGTISFAFQGGEPTLIGLEFYERFLLEVNKRKKKQRINYSIQTNGVLINDEWCQFLKRNNILVGLSLDGRKELHNLYRTGLGLKNTHSLALEATELFKQYGIDYNILTVITKKLSSHITQVYKYYKKKNFSYLQFIPCIDSLDGNEEKFSLSRKDYTSFLIQLFDLWYKDLMNGKYVSIRMFDNIVKMFLGQHPESCNMIGICSVQNVIEADGSIYPCDFYVLDEYKLGNINTHSLLEIKNSRLATQFVAESYIKNQKCMECKWLRLCRGGCKRYNLEENLNQYCDSYYSFYEYSSKKFLEVASKIKDGSLLYGKV